MKNNSMHAAIRLLAATALLGAASTAQAALVTKTDYTITGSNFSGTLTLANSGGTYMLTAFSATYLGYQFDMSNTGLVQQSEYLLIGGTLNGVPTSGPYTNDFNTAYFLSGAGTMIAANASASTAKTDAVYFPLTLTPVRTAPVAGAVPEPATWAMMIAGFGAVCGAMRRRAAVTKVAFA